MNYKYTTEISKEGVPALYTEKSGRKIYIHSKMYPSKEGERFPEIETSSSDTLIILGTGLGYHLKKLCSQPSDKIILIDIFQGIENDANKTNPFLKDDRVVFITGEEPEITVEHITNNIVLDNIKNLKIAEHPASLRAFPEYYSKIKEILLQKISEYAGNTATKKTFSERYVRNALKSIKNFEQYYPVKSLFEKYPKYPALIISSAPSLDQNIDAIKKLADKAVFITVDSAVPALVKQGIEPDFIISIDPQPHIIEHINKSFSHLKSILIRSITSYDTDCGVPTFLSLNSHPISQLIEELYPETIGDISSKTGTVAGDALQFAIKIGCAPIYITGMDFSFPRFNIYARGTAYQNRFALFFSNRFKPVETFNADYIFKNSGNVRNYGVNTRKSFLQYKEQTQNLIQDIKNIDIFHVYKEGIALNTKVINNCEQIINNSKKIEKTLFTKLSTDNQQIHNLINVNHIKTILSDKVIFDRIAIASEIDPDKMKKYLSIISVHL